MDDDLWVDGAAGPVVRPYAVTAGRVHPKTGDFDLISIIVAVRPVGSGAGLAPEYCGILDLCRAPLTVAEIAARIDLPVGTVRVLLGDLLDQGMVLARPPQPASEPHTESVYRAVLNGLRAL